MGLPKVGNIESRAGLKPTSLAFRVSVVPLHHGGSLVSPIFAYSHLSMWLFVTEVSAYYLLHVVYIYADYRMRNQRDTYQPHYNHNNCVIGSTGPLVGIKAKTKIPSLQLHRAKMVECRDGPHSSIFSRHNLYFISPSIDSGYLTLHDYCHTFVSNVPL